jgi:hypothetical protein
VCSSDLPPTHAKGSTLIAAKIVRVGRAGRSAG